MPSFKVKRESDMQMPGLYDYVDHQTHGQGMVCGFNVKTQKSKVAFEEAGRIIPVDWKELTITSRWIERLRRKE